MSVDHVDDNRTANYQMARAIRAVANGRMNPERAAAYWEKQLEIIDGEKGFRENVTGKDNRMLAMSHVLESQLLEVLDKATGGHLPPKLAARLNNERALAADLQAANAAFATKSPEEQFAIRKGVLEAIAKKDSGFQAGEITKGNIGEAMKKANIRFASMSAEERAGILVVATEAVKDKGIPVASRSQAILDKAMAAKEEPAVAKADPGKDGAEKREPGKAAGDKDKGPALSKEQQEAVRNGMAMASDIAGALPGAAMRTAGASLAAVGSMVLPESAQKQIEAMRKSMEDMLGKPGRDSKSLTQPPSPPPAARKQAVAALLANHLYVLPNPRLSAGGGFMVNCH